ncbi:MAG: Rnf-Nqr domain containing protein, partial [bacterium]
MTQKKPSRLSYLTSGIIKENPVLILMIGLCPTLATTTSARDGLGMAAAASFVLMGSNFVVALVRKLVPDSIRIPIFIIIISTFVTIIDYVLQAYQPSLYRVLGVFVPLIVVVVETLAINIYFHMIFRICLALKTSLVDLLYAKSLRL